MLTGRHIILGISGSIAAYKAAEIARLLVKAQAEVTVVMTENACRFITPLTFHTLTRRPVATDLFSDPGLPVPHISLATWADLILIAPATADILARTAAGQANDLLTAILLATTAPILWAPAMNTRMWLNSITQENVGRLTARGQQWILPAEGELACEESGKGRLASIVEIMAAVQQRLNPIGHWQGKKVLLTAGPTREPWDATRFLSNRSTGKMGYCLAIEAQRRGAEVTLVSGPVAEIPPPGVRIIPVTTAQEMHAAALKEFSDAEVVIAAAAVADFRPVRQQTGKIKKDQAAAMIELISNPDILLDMGKRKDKQILVGFAAESQDPIQNGRKKRKQKNCDLLVANFASGAEDAFAAEQAKVYLIAADDQVEEYSSQPKTQIAALICDRIEKIIQSA